MDGDQGCLLVFFFGRYARNRPGNVLHPDIGPRYWAHCISAKKQEEESLLFLLNTEKGLLTSLTTISLSPFRSTSSMRWVIKWVIKLKNMDLMIHRRKYWLKSGITQILRKKNWLLSAISAGRPLTMLLRCWGKEDLLRGLDLINQDIGRQIRWRKGAKRSFDSSRAREKQRNDV